MIGTGSGKSFSKVVYYTQLKIVQVKFKSHSHGHVYVVNTEYVVIYIRSLYQVKIFNFFLFNVQ